MPTLEVNEYYAAFLYSSNNGGVGPRYLIDIQRLSFQIGVFRPYIIAFDLKMVNIGYRWLSELIAFPDFFDFSSPDQTTQHGFHTLYKASAPHPS